MALRAFPPEGGRLQRPGEAGSAVALVLGAPVSTGESNLQLTLVDHALVVVTVNGRIPVT